MEKGFKFRIYPTRSQKQLIIKTFGCCRFVYNYFLDKKIETYKNEKRHLSFYETSSLLTQIKNEFTWLRDVEAQPLQQELRNLDNAYQRFFKEHKNFPKFKSKKDRRDSYRTSAKIVYYDKYIKLPKLGKVKYRDNRKPQGRIISATISRDPSGKFYCSLCCTDIMTEPYIKTGRNVGIDLGIHDFYTASDGSTVSNPRYLNQSLSKIARLNRELSRKTKGSKNYEKARIRLAKQHEKIRQQRKDFLHKLTTQMIKYYDVICVENLKVKNLLQTSNITREISDVSWYEFVRQLEYKAKWYQKQLIKVDTYFASSQICSCCGYQNADLKKLEIREWDCPNCKTHHHRDVNASINILNKGLETII